jgi:NAD(P)-dependent dehydrogenase (short-subunit alcohol dehydrogenase family)
MSASFEHRVALVTGASQGIGAAVALAFGAAGASVVLAARNREKLDAVAREVEDAGGRALVVPTDVSDPVAVERLVGRAVDTFGRLDVACNNAAGGGHRPTPLADVSLDDFGSAYAVNLLGVFAAMKYEIPAMLATIDGKADGAGAAIVNMSSTAGSQGVGGMSGYCATKAGIEALTKVAALDYGVQGIRINALAPGPILTDNLVRAGEAAQRAAADAMPMKRIGTAEEVAAATLWLCSPESAFVTGITMYIDGGKMAGTPPFMVKGA